MACGQDRQHGTDEEGGPVNALRWLLLVLFATATAAPGQPKLEEILRDLQSENEAKVAWAAYHAATRKQRAAIPAIRKALVRFPP